MSEGLYANLITKTFRDNAIRSVIMIDDDFLSYDKLVEQMSGERELEDKKKSGLLKAANLHKFFQSKKIVCDIDSGTEHLDADKVRKCDLIILDYHLEHEDPKRSIELIQKLSTNDHMNLVVIYTSEDLPKTWLQLLVNLKGEVDSGVFLKDKEFKDAWDEFSASGSEIPKDALDLITDEYLVDYIKSDEIPRAVRTEFSKMFGAYARYTPAFCSLLCETHLSKMSMATRLPRNGKVIYGSNVNLKWIQTGNVFVALHSKSDAHNDDAEGLWNTLTRSLHQWNPSYFKILISEIQNWLENEPLPFDADYSSDVEGQAAWLSSILRENCNIKRQGLTHQLFERFIEALNSKLLTSSGLKTLSNNLFSHLENESSMTGVRHDDLFSANHFNIKYPKGKLTDIQENMYHSLNSNLCSRRFSGEYITNGTVLRYISNGTAEYYLCVSPACDTVPEQESSELAIRLSPHRFMKLLTLQACNLDEALDNAVHCRHIFIHYENERIALSVQNANSHNPMIDYVLIHNHANRNSSIAVTGVEVSFLSTTNENEMTPMKKTLRPISQLRDSYTARYQTIASHHSGRVGVDYINFKNIYKNQS